MLRNEEFSKRHNIRMNVVLTNLNQTQTLKGKMSEKIWTQQVVLV